MIIFWCQTPGEFIPIFRIWFDNKQSRYIYLIVLPDRCVERTHKLLIDSQEADGDLFPQTSHIQRSWRISIWKIFTKSFLISMGTRLDLLHDPMLSSSLVSSYLVSSQALSLHVHSTAKSCTSLLWYSRRMRNCQWPEWGIFSRLLKVFGPLIHGLQVLWPTLDRYAIWQQVA